MSNEIQAFLKSGVTGLVASIAFSGFVAFWRSKRLHSEFLEAVGLPFAFLFGFTVAVLWSRPRAGGSPKGRTLLGSFIRTLLWYALGWVPFCAIVPPN